MMRPYAIMRVYPTRLTAVKVGRVSFEAVEVCSDGRAPALRHISVIFLIYYQLTRYRTPRCHSRELDRHGLTVLTECAHLLVLDRDLTLRRRKCPTDFCDERCPFPVR